MIGTISKIVFAIIVLAIIGYGIYYVRTMSSNLGDWSIDGSDTTLKFKKGDTVMFELGENMASIGNLGIVNRLNSGLGDDNGVKFINRTTSKTLADLSADRLAWPQGNLVIKTIDIDGEPRFEVFDTKNSKSVWVTPSSQSTPPAQGSDTFQQRSRASSYFY